MKKNKLTALILIMLFALSPVAFAFGTVAASNPSYEERVVQLVNIEREKAGLDALYIDSNLTTIHQLMVWLITCCLDLESLILSGAKI